MGIAQSASVSCSDTGGSLLFTLNGLSGAPLENAQTVLASEQNRLMATQKQLEPRKEIKLSPQTIQAYNLSAPKLIQQALQPFGYFMRIIRPQGLFYQNGRCTAVHSIARQTDSYHAGDSEDRGRRSGILNSRSSLHAFPLHRGSPLNTPDYEKARDYYYKRLFSKVI